MTKKGGPTVLIVDDEQVHRYMLASMLNDWGYQSATADDGAVAVAAIKKKRYDAVLMDVRWQIWMVMRPFLLFINMTQPFL